MHLSLPVWLAAAALAGKHDPVVAIPEGLAYEGPDTVTVDLLRPGTGAFRPKIFVQAILPDGKPGVFMVDTGADISALSEDVTERLGLVVERDWGVVEGLGGHSSLHHTVVPTLSVGEAVFNDLDFAVDVPNVPSQYGLMPIDGILGANVWSRFVLEIDYPRDQMTLHRPGTWTTPKDASKLFFDGSSIFTRVLLEADSGDTADVVLQVDTGAADVLLFGASAFPYTGMDLGAPWTEGLEAVMGIGGADTMPPSAYQRTTRRIPLERVGIGGEVVKVPDLSARWINFSSETSGPGGIQGLAGHFLFEHHVTTIDYLGGKLALGHHRAAPRRRLDAYKFLLDDDVARFGADPARDFFRAKMYAGLDDLDRADALIEKFLATKPPDDDEAEARVLLAAIRRSQSDLDGAYKALAPMSPEALAEQGELIATVNGLILEEHPADALELADDALARYLTTAGDDYDAPVEADIHTARGDALLALGRAVEANDELLESARLLDNPDAQLLRRARLALAAGDRYGAMAHIRRLLDLYPSNGQYLWFYATLLRDENDTATFRVDMDHALGLLHRGDQPYDYMAHAFHLLGDDTQAIRTMDAGLERDCEPPKGPGARRFAPDSDNCRAWYYAMTNVEPDHALVLIDRALAREGDRSDYLDTKAMVLLARGDFAAAHQAAQAAARLSPDEVYMLWQAERIGQLAKEQGNASPSPGVP